MNGIMGNLIGYTLAVAENIEYVYYPFGRAIAERRKHLGMSQRDLAETVGIQQSGISKIERRDIPIKDIFLLEALAKALECSVDDLRHCRVPAELIGVRLRPPGEPAPEAAQAEARPARHDEAESIAQIYRRKTANATPEQKALALGLMRDALELGWKRMRRVKRYLEAEVEEEQEDKGTSGGEGGEENQEPRKQRPYRTRGRTYNRPAVSGDLRADIGAR